MKCVVLAIIICASFCWCFDLEASESARLNSNPFLKKFHRIVPEIGNDEELDDDHIPDDLKKIIKESLEATPDIVANNRIIGGGVAPRNGYPYQAGLSIKRSSKTSWCGGSIISEKFIVTAAHCVDTGSSVTLILGSHDRTDDYEIGREEILVKRRNIIVHEKWKHDKLLNDIALIRLDSPIEFSDQIKPIALPSNDEESFRGQTGTISGWGHYDTRKKLSRYLRHARSEIVSNSVCEKRYSEFVKDTNICLDGSKGNTTCNGDSGGPLVVRSTDDQPILIGLTSFGSAQGCNKRFPTVFTRLSKYLTWIAINTGIRKKS